MYLVRWRRDFRRLQLWKRPESHCTSPMLRPSRAAKNMEPDMEQLLERVTLECARIWMGMSHAKNNGNFRLEPEIQPEIQFINRAAA